MKIERGKIVEATEPELFEFYLTRGLDDIMDFRTYLEGCKNAGTKIVEEGGDHA